MQANKRVQIGKEKMELRLSTEKYAVFLRHQDNDYVVGQSTGVKLYTVLRMHFVCTVVEDSIDCWELQMAGS